MKEVEAHLLDDGRAAKSVEARVSRAPKSLFEQFRRVANLYFLLAAALLAGLIAPLVFVVGVSMLKEALEDWKRFMQDKPVWPAVREDTCIRGVLEPVNVTMWRGDFMEFGKCKRATANNAV